MLWTVDRIEESYAVLISRETGKTFSIPLFALGAVREGDVLRVEPDADEAAAQRARCMALQSALFVDEKNAKTP